LNKRNARAGFFARANRISQTTGKPDSVMVDQSQPWMTIYLGPVLPWASSGAYAGTREQRPLRDAPAALQQTGFTSLAGHPVWLSALTALVSPLPRPSSHPAPCGGFVSVALSLGSLPVAVSNRPALHCPDFPHESFDSRDHLVV